MKRITSFLLSLLFIFSVLPLSALKINAAPFLGGDGSESSPYLVGTPEALDAVRNYPSAHYQQICDIDMSAWGEWKPIDNFKGVYDGREFEIKGIKIVYSYKVSEATPYGLFATAQGANFKNIRLVDLNIDIDEKETAYQAIWDAGLKATIIVGGICGEAATLVRKDGTTSGSPSTTVFENCSVDGNIRVTNCASATVGGIVGSGAKAISYCNNYADIFIDAKQNYSGRAEAKIICAGISGDGDMFGGTTIKYCTNSGSIEAWSCGSALTCGIGSGHHESDISYCVNFGSIFCSAQKELQDLSYNFFYSAGISGNGAYCCVNYGKISAYGDKPKHNATYLSAAGINKSGKASYCYNLSPAIIAAYFNEYNIVEYPNGAGGRVTSNKDSSITFWGDYSYSSNQTVVNESVIKTNTYETSTYGRNYDQRNGFDLTPDELLLEETYEYFDFKNTWVIDPSVKGPVLRNVHFVVNDNIPFINKLDFAEYKYRADYIISNILNDNVFQNTFITNKNSPAKCIIDAHPKGMQTATEAWAAMDTAISIVNDGPGDALKSGVDQHNLIITYIMHALQYQTIEIVTDTIKDQYDDLAGFVDASLYFTTDYFELVDDFSNHASKNTDEITKVVLEQTKNNDSSMKKLVNAKEWTSLLKAIIDVSKDYNDLYTRINAYAVLYSSAEETKAVVKMMYDLCPDSDKEIKRALSSVKEVTEIASDEIFKSILNGEVFFTTTTTSCSIVADILWEGISDVLTQRFPAAAALCKLANVEMYIVDQLFGIDATVEQYFKLCTLSSLEAISGNVLKQAIENYKKEKSTDNAKILLSALELRFGFIDEAYKESITYSEKIYEEGIVRNIINSMPWADDNNLKNTLVKGTNIVIEMHKLCLTGWIDTLDATYPEIAPLYYKYRDGINQTLNSKRVYIHCPVNVSVYDSSGNLVAEVGEDKVWASGEIAVIYDHGEKEIYFFDSSDYHIVCEGFDNGDMDISVVDYNSNGEIIRTVNYNNVPVTSGSIHTLNQEKVTDTDGNELQNDFDSTQSGAKHKITIQNAVIEGYLTEHEAVKGERVNITAIIPEGYRFVGWIGEVTFEDQKSPSTYFFMPDGDVNISAKFKKIESDDDDKNQKNNGSAVIIICVIITAVALISGITITIIVFKIKKNKPSKEKKQ